MTKPTYIKSIYYAKFIKDLINSGATFDLSETSYTKKVIYHNRKYIFNPDGEEDTNRVGLISKVRKDATEWMGMPFRDMNIDYYNLFKIPDLKEYAFKVDLKSAYWTTAIKQNIISEDTNISFLSKYQDENPDNIKKARLAILGSLATKKTFKTFEKGKEVGEPRIEEEPTKATYLHICKCVDELMKKAANEIDGAFYYYWDCLFVKKGFEQEAISFFKDNYYDVGVNQTKIKIVTLFGSIPYIITVDDKKQYMVRSADFEKIKNLI